MAKSTGRTEVKLDLRSGPLSLFRAAMIIGPSIGGVVGLVVGICAYWRTAPFAVVEGALFGSILAAPLGLMAEGVWWVARNIRQRRD